MVCNPTEANLENVTTHLILIPVTASLMNFGLFGDFLKN